MADNTYQQAFQTYSTAQPDGNYYQVVFLPQNAEIFYPFTNIAIPDDLKGKVAQFNWSLNKWVDSGDDPNTAEILALKNQNAALTKQLAASTIALNSTQQAVAAANKAIAELTKTIAAAEAKAAAPQAVDATVQTGKVTVSAN